MWLCGIIIEIQNVSEWLTASEFPSSLDITASFSIIETQSEQQADQQHSEWRGPLVLHGVLACPGFNPNKSKVELASSTADIRLQYILIISQKFGIFGSLELLSTLMQY